MIPWNYKNREAIQHTEEVGGVPYLSFRALKKTELVADGFSTRLGGVSKGDCAAMNFSYTRGDDPSDVLENFTRMAAALGVERDRMVVSWQTHTVHVRQMTEDDAGKGVIRPREYRDIDGMITDVPGLTLVTFYADCVPLYVVDPVHRAIGLSHAGWRGTVKGMARETLKAMKEAFGTRPEDLTVCIGPSICKDCFEVGEEVVEEFKNAFAPKWHDALFETGRAPGKYQLNLWKANEILFSEEGLKREQIHTTNICTMCNHEFLFSHRKVGAKRGTLAAFLCLRE